MTPLFPNNHKASKPLSTQFSNGHIILEPQQNNYAFKEKKSRFNHAFKHIFAQDDQEHWDDLNLIPSDDLLIIWEQNSVQKILKRYHHFVKETQAKNNKKTRKQDKEFELTPDEIKSLQDISQFLDLTKSYQEKLSEILGECNNHVNPQCQIFNPHFHLLKKRDDCEKFAQIIKILDAQSGIFIVARAPYTLNPNSSFNFEKSNKIFIIKTGYRLWRSKNAEERTKKFNRSEQELITMNEKLSLMGDESKYDTAYPVILNTKKHFPKYLHKKIKSIITNRKDKAK